MKKRITHILKHADVFGSWLESQKDTKVVGDRISAYSNPLANFICDFGHDGVRIGIDDYQTDAYGVVPLPKWAKRYIELEEDQDDNRITAAVARKLLAQAIQETTKAA